MEVRIRRPQALLVLGDDEADRPYVSAPYLSFSIGAPVITVSAPLRGKVPGVIAADLKLDTFSEFVQAQRPDSMARS